MARKIKRKKGRQAVKRLGTPKGHMSNARGPGQRSGHWKKSQTIGIATTTTTVTTTTVSTTTSTTVTTTSTTTSTSTTTTTTTTVTTTTTAPDMFEGFTIVDPGGDITLLGDIPGPIRGCVVLATLGMDKNAHVSLDKGPKFFGATQDIEFNFKFNGSASGNGAAFGILVSSYVGTLQDIRDNNGVAYGIVIDGHDTGEWQFSIIHIHDGTWMWGQIHNPATPGQEAYHDTDYWIKFFLNRDAGPGNIGGQPFTDRAMTVGLGSGQSFTRPDPEYKDIARYIVLAPFDFWTSVEDMSGQICDLSFVKPADAEDPSGPTSTTTTTTTTTTVTTTTTT